MHGKFVGFINTSKEGDSVTPELMKACTMMGMKIIPFSVCYRVNWCYDKTHRRDMKNSLNDRYTIHLAENLGKRIVETAEESNRVYGIYSKIV